MTMKTTIFKTLLLVCLFAFPFAAQADLLTDLVNGDYNGKAASDIQPMPDGSHYAQMTDGLICTYDYQSGKTADTLFNIRTTKLMKLDSIEGFVLSPGNRWMLVYNNKHKIYRRSFEADYYIFDIERNELKPLTKEMPVREPLFSPDSRYIAFARKNNLYIHKLLFNTEVAVTTDGAEGRVINGATDWLYEEEFAATSVMAWSADSKQLLFLRLDESEVPLFTYPVMLSNGYPQNKSFKYPRVGENNAIASVIAYDTQYKSLKRMDLDIPENSYIPRIIMSKNPDQIAVFTLNRNQNLLEMWLANPKSTVCKRTFTEKNADGFVDYSIADNFFFLADNSFVIMSEQDGYRHAYLYSSVGIKQSQITKGSYDITRIYGYSEATQMLYYQAAKISPTERQIYSLRKGKEQCLTPEHGMHNALFSADYKYFTDTYNSVGTAPRTIVRNSAGKALRVLQDNDDIEKQFKALNLPEKQFTTITTSRGDTLNGWILYPQNFNQSKRYPVVQIQYSGPGSQLVYNRWRKDWEYYLAQQGYVVVCFDGRGTDCRGRAFRQQSYMEIGPREAQDQVAVAQYMAQLPYVDGSRIAIWGWSFGGYMSILAMSQPEKVFKCGIAVAPVTDFRLYDSGYTERFMRRPQENVSGYDRTNLAAIADKLNGKLLIIHGLADDNVHCQNTFKYVEALNQADKQYEMQIYPDDNHFLKKGNHYSHVYHRMMEFLRNNL